MAAKDHLSTGQLRMFIPAKELIKASPWEHDRDFAYNSEDQERLETNDELWERKADEASDEGLTRSIEERGVKRPIGLHHTENEATVVGGHHRIAAANEIDPEMLVPVRHYAKPHWYPSEAVGNER